MSKWFLRLVGLLVGAGLVYMVGSRVYELKEEQASPKAGGKKKSTARVVTVGVAEVSRGVVREELLLTGALKPKDSVDVVSKATGRVEKLYFDVGDRVPKGALIAELEDDEIQQRVRRAEAALAVSAANVTQRKAELSNVNANLDRSKQLFGEGLLSPQEFEQQKTSLAMIAAQVELAHAQQQQAEAELRELNIQLEQTKIYAPLAGDAAIRYVDVGALLGPATPILRIVNLATMVSQGNVPERNIGKLRVGNEAEVRVDAMAEKVFRGRIARIAPVLDAATRSALIEIDIPNPDRTLKAEMFARIHLDLGTTREATLIPRDGLVYRGTQPGVYILEGENNDRPVFIPIETGMSKEGEVEVLANLSPGTKIIGRGATMLRDGDRISVAGADGIKGGKQGAGEGAEAVPADGAPAEKAGKKGSAPVGNAS